MDNLDAKLQALAQRAVGQTDVNKLILCKLKALEEVLKSHEPKLFEAYSFKLYQLLKETTFSFPDQTDDTV